MTLTRHLDIQPTRAFHLSIQKKQFKTKWWKTRCRIKISFNLCKETTAWEVPIITTIMSKPHCFTLQYKMKWISFIYSKLILLPWCICTKHMAKCFSWEIWRQLSIFSLRRETQKKNNSVQFEQCIHWKELTNESNKNPKMLIICMQVYKNFVCLQNIWLPSSLT